jgi:hypothetical protein
VKKESERMWREEVLAKGKKLFRHWLEGAKIHVKELGQ